MTVPLQIVQLRLIPVMGPKTGGEISGDVAPPCADVFFPHCLAEFGLYELFEELNRRCVIEELRVDPSTARPRGRDDCGNPEAHTYRSGAGLMAGHSLCQFIAFVCVLQAGVDACGRRARFRSL